MGDADQAVAMFRDGCACSQAIVGTYGPALGLDRNVGLRLAAGFAAGMRRSETCGAVTGAFMVLGLACCGETCGSMEGRQPAYAAISTFADRFRQRHASLTCRELLGCDVSTPDGHKVAIENKLFQTTCAELVRHAAELVEELLPPRP